MTLMLLPPALLATPAMPPPEIAPMPRAPEKAACCCGVPVPTEVAGAPNAQVTPGVPAICPPAACPLGAAIPAACAGWPLSAGTRDTVGSCPVSGVLAAASAPAALAGISGARCGTGGTTTSGALDELVPKDPLTPNPEPVFALAEFDPKPEFDPNPEFEPKLELDPKLDLEPNPEFDPNPEPFPLAGPAVPSGLFVLILESISMPPGPACSSRQSFLPVNGSLNRWRRKRIRLVSSN